MILDNSKIIPAKLIQPFLNTHKNRLQLFFLPPYLPQLNLIEGLWKWLKERVINKFFPNASKIKRAVRKFVSHQNRNKQEIIDRLCVLF